MVFKLFLLINFIQYHYSLLDIFYPFGIENGDRLMFKNDDQFLGPFEIPIIFPYFNRKFSSCFINTNGLISFNNGIRGFTPLPFPLDNVIGVAPFWNDINTWNGGDIFYRQVLDLNVLNQIGLDIRSSFSGFVNFRPTWALIVTWFEVAQYSVSSGRPNNTFQALITTNGRHSFTVFNYHKLEWSRSENINKHAQVGFNAGDGIIYYALNSSFTSNVTDIVFESNVQRPGRWIFRIDDYSIQEGGCNTGGYVNLNPFIVYFIGGEEVLVTGPCFNVYQDTALISIDSDYQTECQILDSNSCKFMTPLIKKIGRVSVILKNFNNYTNKTLTFQANLYTKDQSFLSKISGLDVFYNRDNFSNSELSIQWESMQNIQYYDIYVMRIMENQTQIKLIQENIQQNFTFLNYSLLFFESSMNIIEINYLIVATNRSFNNPNFELKNYLYIFNFFLLNTLNGIRNDYQRSNFFDSICQSWKFSERDPTPYLQGLPPCWPILPTGVNRNVPDSFGDFIQDAACNPSRPSGCSFFHPGANVCYRSQSSFTFDSNTVGQQCCYDRLNNLIVGAPGGGTLDMAHSDNRIEHFLKDVLPFLFCCKLSDNCESYYEKRPSDDGRRWRPPIPAGASGDPHFTTFDGVEYTFNGFGEYTFFEINEINFTCQIRTSPLTLNSTDGTVFKAITIKGDSNTDQVQIELDSTDTLYIYVNGIIVDINDGNLYLNQLNLRISNNVSNIDLTYSEGIELKVVLTPKKNAFLFFSSIHSKFKNKTRGLLGNCNGVKSDDFILPNGTVLNLNPSNDREIFEKFGQKWSLKDEQNFFTYQQGLGASDFMRANYTPKFMQDGIIFGNSSLERIAKDICNDNKKCLYDIMVTSDIEVGTLNLNFDEKIQVFKQDLEKVKQVLILNDVTTKFQ
ncbi:unnamed protein product, partial [Brachionus calyciflorus]